MADSFNKKEREKKRRKRKKDKAEKMKQRKEEGVKGVEFMYLDADGNLTPVKPDPIKKKEDEVSLDDIMISVPKKSEMDQEDPVKKGVVKFFNTEKGFGFILDKSTGREYFVHIDGLNEPIQERDKVEFEIGQGPKGLIALKVKKYLN